MEAFITTMKANNLHARSNSLASKSHPLVSDVEDQLRRLKASEATTSSPSIVGQNLAALKDLHESADNLLQLGYFTQKSFSKEGHGKYVEDMLDGSVRLLDICSSSKDALSQIKTCIHGLESSLRRRNACEFSLATEIRNYFISRKQVNKMVCKCFGNVKRMQKQRNAAIIDNDHDFVALVSLLKEVEEVSLTVFESLLSFVCSPKSKATNWSLVSKLIQSKPVSCEIDGALEDLLKTKPGKSFDVTQGLKALKDLGSTIEELEDGMESVFRCLIKTRVSLLNIVNH
ncbi:hypothetical protein COLO4_21598 [Corchorus olitorius]|uniref:Uncharacterized protein n=1 Tax=Corchorus olitorius TaxID=93759 RepID=A0A1R3ISE6_9ROSI|nr:hypothetical protein COLO4_21598 [Corchorus olitorius]